MGNILVALRQCDETYYGVAVEGLSESAPADFSVFMNMAKVCNAHRVASPSLVVAKREATSPGLSFSAENA